MATIKPFKAIRYAGSAAGDLARVITPPYDVISGEEQRKLHEKSPYNSIRLEYGYAEAADSKADNRYTRAAQTLNEWLDQGVLVHDEDNAFYLYEQSYTYRGEKYRRRGIMAALKLEPYSRGLVLPHEKTHSEPKADRLALLETCQTQFSPIFGLIPDPDALIQDLFRQAGSEDLLADIAENGGSRHRLFSLKDKDRQQQVSRYFAPHPVLIADGHHRYETALYHSSQTDLSRSPGAGYIMAVLVGVNDPGLLMLPTHRLLSAAGADSLEKIISAADKEFLVKDFCALEEVSVEKLDSALLEANKKSSVCAMAAGNRITFLYPEHDSGPGQLALIGLHDKLISPYLKPLPEGEAEKLISYSHDAAYVVDQLKSGAAIAGFILAPFPVTAVLEYSKRGMIMPQKSTYFYPKLPGGLAFYSLLDQ